MADAFLSLPVEDRREALRVAADRGNRMDGDQQIIAMRPEFWIVANGVDYLHNVA